MAAAVETTRLPPINGQTGEDMCSSTKGIYTGRYKDRSPFLTPVSHVLNKRASIILLDESVYASMSSASDTCSWHKYDKVLMNVTLFHYSIVVK